MATYRKYTYANPEALPLEDSSVGDFPDDALLASLGFDPNDEELTISELAEAWNGHKAGARVISGIFVEGAPFAVENTDNEAF